MLQVKRMLHVCLIGGLLLPALLRADDDVALILKTRGQVQVTKGRDVWTTARRGERLNSGSVVRTGESSLAALVFTDDKSLIKIRSNSSVTIKGKRKKKRIFKRLSLAFGELWAKVTRQKSSMQIETPSGVATVKGTEFNCLFRDNVFLVYCHEGVIELFNQFGTMLLGAEEMARLVQGSAPERVEGDPDEYFDLSDEGSNIRIEFEDEEGNKKSLIFDFNK
ncbi:MAG: hypothetical protein D6743_00495 [Calditrichaeota bacterium]|nr:MAG: hypothetical protein D6743_00495 [Calditrichota bacterium]